MNSASLGIERERSTRMYCETRLLTCLRISSSGSLSSAERLISSISLRCRRTLASSSLSLSSGLLASTTRSRGGADTGCGCERDAGRRRDGQRRQRSRRGFRKDVPHQALGGADGRVLDRRKSGAARREVNDQPSCQPVPSVTSWPLGPRPGQRELAVGRRLRGGRFVGLRRREQPLQLTP